MHYPHHDLVAFATLLANLGFIGRIEQGACDNNAPLPLGRSLDIGMGKRGAVGGCQRIVIRLRHSNHRDAHG